MKHDERIKFRFDELTISRYDLVSGEALFIDEQITFSFRQKWFRLSICSSLFLQIFLYCKDQAVQRGGNKTCR